MGTFHFAHPTAVNEVDKDGLIINVVIDYDKNGKRINIIPTAYGRNNFDNYIKNLQKENKILYIDKKNLLSHISKVQFPRGNSKGSNNSIIYKENKFNPDVKKHEGMRGVEISIFLILVQ